MSYDFWLKVGEVCKDIIIPILITCILIRVYVYIGYRNRAYYRGIKFYDTFVENMAKEFKDTKVADIVNFNKNKED